LYKLGIDYYEAVRIAYTQCEDMQKQFNSPKDINNLNKDNKALWELLAKLSMKNYADILLVAYS
jgi:hypothetical protein